MSQSVRQAHYNIRLLIDDLDQQAYATSIQKLSIILSRAIQLVAVRAYQSLAAAPTNLALVAGTFDYSLASSPVAIRQIIVNSDGTEMVKLSLVELNALYKQDSTIASVDRGTPRHYAAYEINNPLSGADTAFKIRVGPTPDAADTLKIYYDLIPDRGAGNFIETASAVIPFSPPLIQAVESMAASECIASMDEDDLKRRKISRGYAEVLMRNADRAIMESNFRQRMMEGQETVDEVRIY